MRVIAVIFALTAALAGAGVSPVRAEECASPDTAIGLSRIAEIETAAGPIFGTLSRQHTEPSFLAQGEVVLTFDDGPSPWVTKSILETLAAHCTRATFFMVGKMAAAYPSVVRQVISNGHTVGGHTWSHPFNMPRMKLPAAQEEIERGFAATAAAAGGEIAPFFRFTGLRDSPALLGYLQKRGIASFTVDVVSDDSFTDDPEKLTRVTLSRVAARGGGIILFHDIKSMTAKALPAILDGLKAGGYKVVHMVPASAFVPDAAMLARYEQALAERTAGLARPPPQMPRLIPFYGALSALRGDTFEPFDAPGPPVTTVESEPRDRSATSPSPPATSEGRRVLLKAPDAYPREDAPAPEAPAPARRPPAAPAAPPAPQEVEVLPWKRETTVRATVPSPAGAPLR